MTMLPNQIPDHVLTKCQTDPAFRAVVDRQLVKAIEDARFVADRLSADLTKLRALPVAIITA